MNKKGQSALEFIMTYGWALVVLLLVISSLWFTFGGDKFFVNEKCMMGPGFLCKDFSVDEGSVTLIVKNSQGKNIDSFSFDVPACSVGSDTPPILNGGEQVLSVSDCTFTEEIFEGPLNFEYSFGESTISHSKVADITAIVQDVNSGDYNSGNGGGHVPDGATQLLYKFDEGDGDIVKDETSNGNDGTLITLGDLVDNRGAETGDLLNFRTVLPFEGVTDEDSHSGVYSFYDTRARTVFSDEFIPIDLNAEYNLTGWFKKYGSEDSHLFFGYVPYDENKNPIVRRYVCAVAGSETSLYEAVSSSDTSVKVLNASKWSTRLDSYVAFNTDNSGSFNDMPNSNLSNRLGVRGTNGCQPTFQDNGDYWEVNLCGGQTVGVDAQAGTNVRQQRDSGTYMYTAAVGGPIVNSWANYSSVTSGESLSSENLTRWWRGTKYARIMFLINYGSGSASGDSKTRIDDILLTATPMQYTNKWDTGYYGGAIDFNGYEDKIETGVNDSGTINNQMITVEAWIKPRSLNNSSQDQSYRTIVGNWEWNVGGWLLRINNNHDLLFHISDGDDSGKQDNAICSGNLKVQEGVWQHVAGVWNGTEIRAYIDGVECDSKPFTSYAHSNLDITIGWSTINNQLPIYFDGLIDELRISDYVRYE